MFKRFTISMVGSLLALLASFDASAATIATHKSHSKSHKITETGAAQKKMARMSHSSKSSAKLNSTSYRVSRGHRYYERFSVSSFADNQVEGDITAGEDPIVRAAAVEALGNMNGTIVAIDPDSGRVLAMVNQKMALSAGAQPCSTIKVAVALAALSENVITKDTQVPLGKYYRVDLTTALAHSNNAYFEAVGRKLGFEKVSYYARQFGLGELAGWNIEGEHLGTFPSTVLDEKLGGVGKMCSFGESISLTPLQLAALISAIANGGTLYYLQHPTTPEEVTNFAPKAKRKLVIGPIIPEIADGMAGAVDYGTARLLKTNFMEEPVLGKTGTCSKDGTRFGWFGSFANTQYGRIVTVVFLEGGRPTFGPKAAELAGHLYRNLYDHDFFTVKPSTVPVRTAGTAPVGAVQ
ncbi:MAG: penicillin-binding transpeptidase domain-containing protein [Acidobacteriota bacterium]|nr:penicillin-binding transpeptidase domain-containing protein [Acidobacteriota bacterium]